MGSEVPLCRYYVNGTCSREGVCKFRHVAGQADNICMFYQAGKCSFGNACRFHHVKPKNTPKPQFVKEKFKPVQLAKPGLNVQAPEFVPSWLKPKVTSYASAAAASSSSSSSTSKDYERERMMCLQLCPYFETNGDCFKTDEECPFAHGELCDMCNKWSLHPYNHEKRAMHVKQCTEFHEKEMEHAFLDQKSAEMSCGICMENIVEKDLRFGILNGCKHCFCLQCIRQWRARHEKDDIDSKVSRSCPECRQHSDYVIPSVMWVDTELEKTALIDMYKENLKGTLCKYYNGDTTRGNCQFGNKCFYKHQLPDGSIDPGESPHVRRRPQLSDFLSFDDSDDEMMNNMDRMDLFQRMAERLNMFGPSFS